MVGLVRWPILQANLPQMQVGLEDNHFIQAYRPRKQQKLLLLEPRTGEKVCRSCAKEQHIDTGHCVSKYTQEVQQEMQDTSQV